MKSILISAIILMFVSSVSNAQNLSKDEPCIFTSKYFDKIEVKNDFEQNSKSVLVDITSLENDDFEVKISVNKYFKPFVIMGAKVSEFLSSFSLSDLGIGIGADVQMSESLSCYAKYSSSTISDARLASIDSSAVYMGIQYGF